MWEPSGPPTGVRAVRHHLQLTISPAENRVNRSVATDLARTSGLAKGLFQHAVLFCDVIISVRSAEEPLVLDVKLGPAPASHPNRTEDLRPPRPEGDRSLRRDGAAAGVSTGQRRSVAAVVPPLR
jgi:hypothetical protein